MFKRWLFLGLVCAAGDKCHKLCFRGVSKSKLRKWTKSWCLLKAPLRRLQVKEKHGRRASALWQLFPKTLISSITPLKSFVGLELWVAKVFHQCKFWTGSCQSFPEVVTIISFSPWKCLLLHSWRSEGYSSPGSLKLHWPCGSPWPSRHGGTRPQPQTLWHLYLSLSHVERLTTQTTILWGSPS